MIQLALIEEDVEVLKRIGSTLASVKPEGTRSRTQRPGQNLYALRALDPEGVAALGPRFAALYGQSEYEEVARKLLGLVDPQRQSSLNNERQWSERQAGALRALHSMAGGSNASASTQQFGLDYGALTSPDGAEAIKAGLKDERASFRNAALEVMWSNPRQHGAISELIEMLADEQDVQVWSRAASVLKKATNLTDEQRAAAIPILAKKYDDEALFEAAAGALNNIAPEEHAARRSQHSAMLRRRNEQRQVEREQQQRLTEQQRLKELEESAERDELSAAAPATTSTATQMLAGVFRR